MAKPDRPLVEDAGVPQALREALQAARAREPRDADMAQLASSLGLALPPSVPPPVLPPATTGGGAGLKLGLVAKGAAVLGAAALATTVILKVSAPAPHAPPGPSVQVVQAAVLPSAAPLATEELALPEAPAPNVAPAPRPHREERSPARETAPSAPAALPEAPPVAEPDAPANDVASRLREEALLVRKAQSMLSSDPAGALRLTAERRRQFPGGVLAQEASVVAIEALLRLGRRQEAEAQARAFEAAHPGSVHARRVRRLLEDE